MEMQQWFVYALFFYMLCCRDTKYLVRLLTIFSIKYYESLLVCLSILLPYLSGVQSACVILNYL